MFPARMDRSLDRTASAHVEERIEGLFANGLRQRTSTRRPKIGDQVFAEDWYSATSATKTSVAHLDQD